MLNHPVGARADQLVFSQLGHEGEVPVPRSLRELEGLTEQALTRPETGLGSMASSCLLMNIPMSSHKKSSLLGNALCEEAHRHGCQIASKHPLINDQQLSSPKGLLSG